MKQLLSCIILTFIFTNLLHAQQKIVVRTPIEDFMPKNIERQWFGNVKSFVWQPDGSVDVVGEGRTLKIQFYNNFTIKLSLSDSLGKFNSLTTAAILAKTQNIGAFAKDMGSTINIESKEFTISIKKNPFEIKIFTPKAQILSTNKGAFWLNQTNGFNFKLQPNEQWLGGGARQSPTVMRMRQRFALYNGDNSANNFTIPFFMSNMGYGIYFDNPGKGYIDISSEVENVVDCGFISGTTSAVIMIGNTYDDILRNFTKLSNAQTMPPAWAMGVLLNCATCNNQNQTELSIAQWNQNKFSFDALLLNNNWYGGNNKNGTLYWDTTTWNNPKQLLTTLQQQNTQLILPVVPYINKNTPAYSKLEDAKLLVTDEKNNPLLIDTVNQNYMVDVSISEAQSWFWRYCGKLNKQGIAGFAFNNVYFPYHPKNAKHKQANAYQVHNILPLELQKGISKSFLSIKPNKRLFMLSDGGFAGMQQYAFAVSNQQINSLMQLQLQTAITLSMGLSAQAFMHPNLNLKENDNEAFLSHAIALTAFMPIMQLQINPLALSPTVQQTLQQYSTLRQQWLPYNYSLAWLNAIEGTPLAAPLFYYNNKVLVDAGNPITDAFFWGKDVIIAPFWDTNAAVRPLLLPSGTWFNYFTNQKLNGDVLQTIPNTNNQLPVFIKANTVIAMQSSKRKATQYNTDTLILHVYPAIEGYPHTSALYCDDGLSIPNTNLPYDKLLFDVNITAQAALIACKIENGKYNNAPTTRNFEWILHTVVKAPSKITWANQKLKAVKKLNDLLNTSNTYYYDKTTQQLHIKVNFDNKTNTALEILGKKMW